MANGHRPVALAPVRSCGSRGRSLAALATHAALHRGEPRFRARLWPPRHRPERLQRASCSSLPSTWPPPRWPGPRTPPASLRAPRR